jgi:hypothetical protein
MIVAGWSAYPRHLDFAAFRRIADEVGAYLLVDMAHFAGLVAAGLHPSPVPYADVVTTTTHKTLGGPRGGVILSRADLARAINSAVFPGQQGGPLEHVIAAKAVAFKVAAGEEFAERQRRTLAGARILAGRLLADDVAEAGITVLTGGTEVHLVLVDLRASALDGQQAEDRLHRVGITVNRNAVPFDPRPPMGRSTRTSSGATPSRAPRTTSSSSAAAGTAWPPPTTWPRTTASPTSPCWRRAGWPAATWPATPRSSAPTTCGTRAPASTSTRSSCGRGWRRSSTTTILFSQRGVLNLAHTSQDVRDSVRRVDANRLNGVDAEWLDPHEVKEVCPIVNVSPDVRYPVLGATYQPRAGIAKHDHVAWALARGPTRSAST